MKLINITKALIIPRLCLLFTSHRQRGHLETAPPFTVPCEGREARFLHHSHQESNPGSSRGSSIHYRRAAPVLMTLLTIVLIVYKIILESYICNCYWSSTPPGDRCSNYLLYCWPITVTYTYLWFKWTIFVKHILTSYLKLLHRLFYEIWSK